ncbi:hypothetical protein WG66_008600 [Moniliophthora roreri]|uniref:Uncharacterized protein n=1 Tax=Moniliophthora roreri TaxID=221103 RepID=A0A0W0FK97_MONRR|nr:hypothetical protein WG66_008600 [Moniliophthora roreri]
MPIPLIPLNLANFVVESLLFGVFLVLNATSIILQLLPPQQPRTRNTMVAAVRKPMFIGAVVLLVTVTAHWICSVLRLFNALVYFKQGAYPQEYYSNLSETTYVAKTAILVASIATGDIMIVYRLWIVCSGNNYVILIPSLTLIGLLGKQAIPLSYPKGTNMRLVSGIAVSYHISNSPPGSTVFISQNNGWIIAEGVFTITTNGYCTGLIAWIIWRTKRRNRSIGVTKIESPSLTTILAIFIESALLYSSWLLAFIVTFAARCSMETLIADSLPSVAGIAFSLINVRARFIRQREHANSIRTMTTLRFHEDTITNHGDDVDFSDSGRNVRAGQPFSPPKQSILPTVIFEN